MDEKKRAPRKVVAEDVDITQLKKKQSLPIDDELRAHFTETRKLLARLDDLRRQLEGKLDGLESQETMSNDEVEALVTAFNRARTLASDIQEKNAQAMGSQVSKII